MPLRGLTKMPEKTEHRLPKLLDARNWWKVYLLAWLPVGSAYLLILGLFLNITGMVLITTWVSNIIVPMVLGLGVCWLTANITVHAIPRVQIALHVVCAIMFSTLWALGTFRLLQVFRAIKTGEWNNPNWPSEALAWQLFQGMLIYFTIISATYAFWAYSQLAKAGAHPTGDAVKRRIFAKTEEGFVPLDMEDVSAARNLDGLTFLFVGDKKFDAKLTLGELEQALPVETFLRIHRSALINLNHILSIEPAGNGRLIVHLRSGQSLATSRAGAAALKTRVALV